MAKGTKVDELYLQLSLDMSDLEKGVAGADKKVTDLSRKLNTELKFNKIKADIELAGIDNAERSIKGLKVQFESLTRSVEIQQKRVEIAAALHSKAVKELGENGQGVKLLESRYLQEQKALALLEKQLRQTNEARKNINVNAGNNAGTGVLEQLKTAAYGAQANLSLVNSKLLVLTALAASGGGLFNLVKGATEAGESVYQLATKLSIGAAEAGSLNKILRLTGTDSQSFIATMLRIDRAVSTAGKNGNATTQALEYFGISIKDTSGNLLPLNQQIEQLAKGYKLAAAAGEEEAFVAEVLGARGAALIPMLKEYEVAAQAASRIKTIGIDPAQAHELGIEFKIISAEASQLNNAMGNALLPIAKEIAPVIADGFGETVQFIKENKDAIVDVTEVVIELGGTVKDVLVTAFAPMFGFVIDNKDSVIAALQQIRAEMQVLQEKPWAIVLPPMLQEIILGDEVKQKKIQMQAAEAAKKAARAAAEATAKENEKIQAEEEKRLREQLQNRQRANAETIKAQQELDAVLYRLNHDRVQNELHDIDLKTQEMIKAGVQEQTALELAEAKKAEITKRCAEEIQKERESLTDKIFAQNASALQIRLREIEREKQAWIKKTNDEVRATQWAEQEKIQAVKNAALDAIRNHQEELELINKVIEARKNQAVIEGTDKNGNTVDYSSQYRARAIKSAMEELQAFQREALNLPKLSFAVTPEHLELLQSSMRAVEDSVLHGMVTVNNQALNDMTANMPQIGQIAADNYFSPWQSKVQQLSGALSNIGGVGMESTPGATNPVIKNFSISIPVTIQANVNSDTDLNQLADKVAAKIEKPLVQAIQGADEYGV